MPLKNESSQLSSSDLKNSIIMSIDPYHRSVSGGILLPLPTNTLAEIFSYLRHGQFDKFRPCFDLHHREIIHMKNEHGQNVLHILTIHAYPYQWVRLLMMRGCDPCCQDNDGYTPAHYAIERDDVEMLKALTMRFYSEIRAISEEHIIAVHERCLKALSLKQQQGLTAFMLCCQYQSIKCFNYLCELNINDVNVQDNFGDTCLHYAVAHRKEILVEKLINQCHADVNNGASNRPSALDILQFNREQQKLSDRIIDDSIEQILLLHHARNRCQIRIIMNKRKISDDQEEASISNLACLTDNSSINSQLIISTENHRDIRNTEEYYKSLINSVPNNSIEWTNYAYNFAIIYITREEYQLAFDLLEEALKIRSQFENQTEEIKKIQHAIDEIEKNKKKKIK